MVGRKLHFLVAYLLTFPTEIFSVVKRRDRDFFNCNSVYHQEGDVNVGAVLDLGCTFQDLKNKYMGIIPAICAIENINRDTSFLQSLKLGFTILNQCNADLDQRLLQYLPDSGVLATNTSCPADNRGLPWYDVSAVMIQVRANF